MSADLPSENREINGTVYTVSMLPLKKWMQLKKVAFGVIGAPLAEALASAEGGIKDLLGMNISNKAIGQGLYAMCANSSPESDELMLKLLSEATMVGDNRLDPVGHWPRNMGNLGPYLAFALEVQFADFFKGLLGALPGDGQGGSK